MTNTPPSAAAVEVEGLRIRYGSTEVVKGIGLSVAARAGRASPTNIDSA